MNKHTIGDLRQMQSLPLKYKVMMTQQRIKGWYENFDGDVYVSFSGGKDSTVLVDIVTKMGYTDIPLVFVDTGLEYPEIREFVRSYGDRVTWVRPKMTFKQVIEKYGYPVISKDVSQCVYEARLSAKNQKCDVRETYLWNRSFNPKSDFAKKHPTYSRARYDYLNDAPFKISDRCCKVMKKKPVKDYEKETNRKPILATMASESAVRTASWLKNGCDAFEAKRPLSNPMSFWTEQDVLLYIKQNNLPICSIYGDIVEDLTGTEEVEGQLTISDVEGWENQELFDAKRLPLKTTGLTRTGCMFCAFGCHLDKEESRFKRMKRTHPKQYDYIMRPWEQGGLNYKEIIDWINEHGNLNIKY